MPEIPKELDWVTERDGCSVRQVFERLCASIANDVQIRQRLRKRSEFGYEYGFDCNRSGDIITVSRSSQLGGKAIALGIQKGSEIIVSEELGAPPFLSARVTLNEFGECVLIVDNLEMRDWQFRKKALEGLFFQE